ncbi:hypothetical protein KOW79_006167 [Hemibagrus wyckioides]|uniref:Uncharacterized protein n=1 Tax=Hemibagrus wyckioides TaxID=337641 RepID=A0A9D3SNP0_9TELE|nr:cystatin-like protein [Hemibagrus wyckioides]KAG7329945.1 hypothetical protein KOW79_006167 [Hemibagrus wyckioides]
MDGTLKVLLLAALILLVSVQASKYESLPDGIRKHVDKALNNVRNTYEGHHVAYESLIGTPRPMEKSLHINVLFTVKKCESNPHNMDECVPQSKTLYRIDCLLCKTKDNEELLDCAKWLEVKNNKRDAHRGKCSGFLPGSHILAQKTEDSQKMGGCPGCM